MAAFNYEPSRATLRDHVADRRVPRFAPLLVVVARPILALSAQGLTILLFSLLNVPDPTITVRNWWTVYSTLVDLVCLALLAYLVRREGLRLVDLIGFDRRKLKADLLIGLGIFVVVFPLTVFGGGMLASKLAYGSFQAELPQGAFIRTLPLLAVLYSRLLWWPIWSFTEELTFQGYALPRLQAITKNRWVSVALVSFFWALQHSFLPWINLQHAFYLLITFLPLTILLPIIYMRIRRLSPLILAHWLMDLTSVMVMVQVG